MGRHKKLQEFQGYPARLHVIVEDPTTDSIIGWSESGKSFIIKKESEFITEVLPRLTSFDMKAFRRRLRDLGFKKIKSVPREYARDDFLKGKSPFPMVPIPVEELEAILNGMLDEYEKREQKEAMETKGKLEEEEMAIIKSAL